MAGISSLPNGEYSGRKAVSDFSKSMLQRYIETKEEKFQVEILENISILL